MELGLLPSLVGSAMGLVTKSVLSASEQVETNAPCVVAKARKNVLTAMVTAERDVRHVMAQEEVVFGMIQIILYV